MSSPAAAGSSGSSLPPQASCGSLVLPPGVLYVTPWTLDGLTQAPFCADTPSTWPNGHPIASQTAFAGDDVSPLFTAARQVGTLPYSNNSNMVQVGDVFTITTTWAGLSPFQAPLAIMNTPNQNTFTGSGGTFKALSVSQPAAFPFVTFDCTHPDAQVAAPNALTNTALWTLQMSPEGNPVFMCANPLYGCVPFLTFGKVSGYGGADTAFGAVLASNTTVGSFGAGNVGFVVVPDGKPGSVVMVYGDGETAVNTAPSPAAGITSLQVQPVCFTPATDKISRQIKGFNPPPYLLLTMCAMLGDNGANFPGWSHQFSQLMSFAEPLLESGTEFSGFSSDSFSFSAATSVDMRQTLFPFDFTGATDNGTPIEPFVVSFPTTGTGPATISTAAATKALVPAWSVMTLQFQGTMTIHEVNQTTGTLTFQYAGAGGGSGPMVVIPPGGKVVSPAALAPSCTLTLTAAGGGSTTYLVPTRNLLAAGAFYLKPVGTPAPAAADILWLNVVPNGFLGTDVFYYQWSSPQAAVAATKTQVPSAPQTAPKWVLPTTIAVSVVCGLFILYAIATFMRARNNSK